MSEAAEAGQPATPTRFSALHVIGITIRSGDSTALTASLFLPSNADAVDRELNVVDDEAALLASLRVTSAGPSARPLAVPCILEAVPYRLSEGTLQRDWLRLGELARCGYACLRIDLRGSGNSQGVLLDEYLEEEHADCEAALRWTRDQPWSNGQLLMFGKSWSGFNGLQMAARQRLRAAADPRTPQLSAVLSAFFTDDRYGDDIHYRGGALLASEALPWSTQMLLYNACAPLPRRVGGLQLELERQCESDRGGEAAEAQTKAEAGPAAQAGRVAIEPGSAHCRAWLERLDSLVPFDHIWLSHVERDDYWRHGSVCEPSAAAALAAVPLFLIGGHADGYTEPVWRMMARSGDGGSGGSGGEESAKGDEGHSVSASGTAARQVVLGPWGHQYPDDAVPGPSIGWIAEAVAFMRKLGIQPTECHVDAPAAAVPAGCSSTTAASVPSLPSSIDGGISNASADTSRFLVWQWTPCADPVAETSATVTDRACSWLRLTLDRERRQLLRPIHACWPSVHAMRAAGTMGPEGAPPIPPPHADSQPLIRRVVWPLQAEGRMAPYPAAGEASSSSSDTASASADGPLHLGRDSDLLHGLSSCGSWLHWGGSGLADCPSNQSRDDHCAGTLRFDGPPLVGEPLRLFGIPQVNLRLSATDGLAMRGLVVARLCAVRPASAGEAGDKGEQAEEVSVLLARGMLNLEHIYTHNPAAHDTSPSSSTSSSTAAATAAIPPQLVQVELSGVSCVIEADWHLRLVLATSYWPWLFPHPEQSQLQLHWPAAHGDGGGGSDGGAFVPSIDLPVLQSSHPCMELLDSIDLAPPPLPPPPRPVNTEQRPTRPATRVLDCTRTADGLQRWHLSLAMDMGLNRVALTLRDSGWVEEASGEQEYCMTAGHACSARVRVRRSFRQQCDLTGLESRVLTDSSLTQQFVREMDARAPVTVADGVELDALPPLCSSDTRTAAHSVLVYVVLNSITVTGGAETLLQRQWRGLFPQRPLAPV